MNIREFAEICGETPSKVSRALNSVYGKSIKTQREYERIRAKAAEVGFKPNFHAKAMLSKSTHSIGFIIAQTIPDTSRLIIEGVASVLCPEGFHIAMLPSENNRTIEASAINRMIYYEVEAIIHYPSLQRYDQQNTDHVARQLAKAPGAPPLISLVVGTDIPEAYQIRFREYETGKTAALRQLRLGCRRFGILDTPLTMLYSKLMIQGYRETLLAAGVPPQNIREVHIADPQDYAAFEPLRDVDGLWCSYYILLISYREALSRVCSLEKLHVDAVCSEEFLKFLYWLHAVTRGVNSYFASIYIFQFSLRETGIRAANMFLKIRTAPSRAPYTEYISWLTTEVEGPAK